MEHTFDSVIVGAGQAASLAERLTKAGWTVALVEKKWLGGICLNVGCTSAKAMARLEGLNDRDSQDEWAHGHAQARLLPKERSDPMIRHRRSCHREWPTGDADAFDSSRWAGNATPNL